eukprot:1957343-Pyramimonas_sp.AAC.1
MTIDPGAATDHGGLAQDASAQDAGPREVVGGRQLRQFVARGAARLPGEDDRASVTPRGGRARP